MSTSQDIQLAVNRIYRALRNKRQRGYRDIRLGLERVQRVVPDEQEWKGVHVGGTNGKGSIVAFLSGLFHLAGIQYGSYTSPAFPKKHNGVIINGLYINPRMYEMEREHVLTKWKGIASGWELHHGEEPETLSPFELETATAFRAFNKMHVPYGIVEVGMGGATDATNVMKSKVMTIISKIGLDHQEYLGNNIENIARVKAGIMQKNVPCVVDHTNKPSVIQILRQHARKIGTEIILTWKAEPFLMTLDNNKWKLESYQIQNLLCAALAFRHLFPHKEINLDQLMATKPFLPGRMETVKVTSPSGDAPRPVLVDGAHNLLGIEGLFGHVEKHVRKDNGPVTWIMGMSSSKHKPFAAMIETIVRPQDNFAFVEYIPGPNEPPPAPANFGVEHARTIIKNEDQLYKGDPNISSALRWAIETTGRDVPIVTTGSLYLIRDLYNLEEVVRTRERKTRPPGRSQLYRYTQLAQQRKLTHEEEREFKKARRHWYLSPYRNQTFAKVREGGKPNPIPTRKKVSKAQRQAALHVQHRTRYRQSCRDLKSQIAELSSQGEAKADDIAALAVEAKSAEERADKHEHLHQAAMLRVRGYRPLPFKKIWGHERIFLYPAKPKPRNPQEQSPYVRAQKAGRRGGAVAPRGPPA